VERKSREDPIFDKRKVENNASITKGVGRKISREEWPTKKIRSKNSTIKPPSALLVS